MRQLFSAIIFLTLCAGVASHPADQHTESIWLDRGAMPALALDSQDRLHLVYVAQTGGELIYRIGNIDGEFGEPEVILTASRLWDPRIVIDENDDPHIVVSDGHFHNRYTFYANRVQGQWRPANTRHRLVVFDRDRDGFNRTTSPSLAVADGRAYVGTFTVGGSGRFVDFWGALAFIKNLDSNPTVSIWRNVFVWNPQVVYQDGRLWVGGRNVSVGGRHFDVREHNPDTLAEYSLLQPGYLLSPTTAGEQTRMVADLSGDIMAAGTPSGQGSSAHAGWYQSIDRMNRGMPAARYRTSLHNPNGNGLPLRDLNAEDRIYIFYWSDESRTTFEAGQFNLPECPDTVQLHFARIEKGVEASELQKLTTRSQPHGGSYRTTPAAVAHPHGGAIVIFRECGGDMYFTSVGEQVSPHLAHNPFFRVPASAHWRETWIGKVNDKWFPWVYNADEEWIYLSGSNDSLWYFDLTRKTWRWSNKYIFPSVYELPSDLSSPDAKAQWVVRSGRP